MLTPGRDGSDRRASREAVTSALVAAAQDLLIESGHAGLSTRKIAERAGVNHGLVHYYFGSMENLLLEVVERFTAELITRQREMYAADVPFIEKWRQAMRFLDEDAESGYQKVWLELQSLAWNNPPIAARVRAVHQQWMDVVGPAFETGLAELGVDRRRYPPRAVVSLVFTFNLGVMLERLSGLDSGHRPLLRMIDRVVERQHEQATRG